MAPKGTPRDYLWEALLFHAGKVIGGDAREVGRCRFLRVVSVAGTPARQAPSPTDRAQPVGHVRIAYRLSNESTLV
jgi:hypothetical protein